MAKSAPRAKSTTPPKPKSQAKPPGKALKPKTTAKAPAPKAAATSDRILRYYRDMLLIRRFEERVASNSIPRLGPAS